VWQLPQLASQSSVHRLDITPTTSFRCTQRLLLGASAFGSLLLILLGAAGFACLFVTLLGAVAFGSLLLTLLGAAALFLCFLHCLPCSRHEPNQAHSSQQRGCSALPHQHLPDIRQYTLESFPPGCTPAMLATMMQTGMHTLAHVSPYGVPLLVSSLTVSVCNDKHALYSNPRCKL